MGNFYSFLRLSSRIFRCSDDFLANFRETHEFLASTYCAVGVSAVLVLLLASLYHFWHAVAGGPAVTGFPAVVGVLSVTVLVFLLILVTLC
jgi:hypothetical protein